MKIRHPILIKTLGLGGAWLVRLWMGTLRSRYRPLCPDIDPRTRGLCERYIYTFWHENLLLPAYLFGRPNIHVLISQHADGQLIAEICRHLRFSLVRGSSTRGGVTAVRRMLRTGRGAHLAITPDGPRGPRRRVQPGLIYLAARTTMPIVPVGIGYRQPWRLRSWDRFAVPRPWSRTLCLTGAPIHIPAGAGKDRLEEYRIRIEQALQEITDLAERLANAPPPPAAADSAA